MKIADFGADDFRDFAKARATFQSLAHDRSVTGNDVDSQLGRLKTVIDWAGFYQALAEHDFLSGAFDVLGFLDVWDRIWGYDVHGILEAGAVTPTQEADSAILMPHLLGARFLKSEDRSVKRIRDLADPIRDHHVHFGQLVELGLLWHGQLRSRSCTWEGYRPRMSGDADSFAAAKQRREFESLADPQFAPVDKGMRQTFAWASLLAQCRLLLFYFERNADRPTTWESDEPGRFLEAVLDAAPRLRGDSAEKHNTDRLAQLESNHSTVFETARRLSIEASIASEKRMLATLRYANSKPQTIENRERAAFAAAYLALKNAAISRVSSEGVGGFKWFTRALAILQNIYDQDLTLFRKGSSFVEALRKNIVRSRSFASDVRFAVRPATLMLNADPRTIGYQWQTAAMAGEDDSVGIVLAFHRRDLEDFKNRGTPALNAIRDLIGRLDHEGYGKVVGLDLIGSEVAHDEDSMHSSTEFLFASVDFVLAFRADLAAKLGRDLFVTIHLGEHVCERALGILTFAAIMTDPRLDPGRDRFGHALILPDVDLGWADSSPGVKTSRETALGRLVTNCAPNSNPLFDQATAKRLLLAAQALVDDPEDLDSFNGVRSILLNVIESDHFSIEICPYSNKMIRQVDPRNHPWANSIGKAKLLMGTDDPSLTQTQPWIETAAFYHTHSIAT